MTNKYQATSNVNIKNDLDIGFNPFQRYEAVAPLYIKALEASDRHSGPIFYQLQWRPLIPVPSPRQQLYKPRHKVISLVDLAAPDLSLP
jgi:hypothetical protein